MDQRRVLIWLVFTALFFSLYMNMQKPQPPAKQDGAEQAAANANQNPLFKEPAKNPAGENQVQAENPEVEVLPEVPESVVTLGSMDPAKKFNLMVTLSSKGASVERVELVGQHSPGKFKFLALEHKGGDLGYLGLVQAENGLRIRVIPDGSAASLAKSPNGDDLKPGDVIVKIGDQSVKTYSDVEEALGKTKPGQTIQVDVERDKQPIQFQAELAHAPLDLIRSQPHSTEQIVGNEEINGLRTTLASINSVKIPIGKVSLPALAPTLEENWQVNPLKVDGGEGVEFRLPLQGLLKQTDSPNLELVKRFRLLPSTNGEDGYLLDLETEVINNNPQSVSVGVRQEGPTGLNLEGWWYSVKISQAWFSSAGSRDIAFADGDGRHWLKTTSEIYNHAKGNNAQPHKVLFTQSEPIAARTLKYIGLDSQYFNASLLPHPEAPNSLSDLAESGARVVGDISKINRYQTQAANIAFWVDSAAKSIEPGKSSIQRFQLFLGPKESGLLSTHGLQNTIEYGWFPWVAKPLGWILHFFYAIVRNYGLAIILLTVCVRLALFPLGRRAAITGQRMQELQPEIKKINEKYPEMEKRAKAMQELYAKHDFKPLAGCLPMFLQIPIFIGLYRCLSVDVSLRQEPLIPGLQWCSNLAGPDQLYNWSSWMPEYFSGRGTGWLGPYLNILPLITVVLFLVQQFVTMPKATDPQSQMSQTMMKWMTAFMAVFFFKVPAGLCIYFITSSIWSLIERQIVKKTIPPSSASLATTVTEPPSRPKPQDRRTSSTEPQKISAMDKMRQMLDKPAVRSGTQRGTKKRKGKG